MLVNFLISVFVMAVNSSGTNLGATITGSAKAAPLGSHNKLSSTSRVESNQVAWVERENAACPRAMKPLANSFDSPIFLTAEAPLPGAMTNSEERQTALEADAEPRTAPQSLDTKDLQPAGNPAPTDQESSKKENKTGLLWLKRAGSEGESTLRVTPDRTFTATLKGSMCVSCLKSLEKRLIEEKGIAEVQIGLTRRSVTGSYPKTATIYVDFDSGKITAKKLMKVIKRQDFKVRDFFDTRYSQTKRI